MNGYRRILAVLKGEPSDKIPVILHNFLVAAAELNISMGRYRESPGLIADSFIKSVEKYDLDGVLVDIDTVTLAGSVGVAVDFPEREPARSPGGFLDSLENLKSLKPVSVENYKYIQIWFEAVRLLKDYSGDEILIRAKCDQSPFSLAIMMRGT
jgi:uroporphyrinogen decarboxylase